VEWLVLDPLHRLNHVTLSLVSIVFGVPGDPGVRALNFVLAVPSGQRERLLHLQDLVVNLALVLPITAKLAIFNLVPLTVFGVTGPLGVLSLRLVVAQPVKPAPGLRLYKPLLEEMTAQDRAYRHKRVTTILLALLLASGALGQPKVLATVLQEHIYKPESWYQLILAIIY